MDILTVHTLIANITPLLTHLTAWFDSHKNNRCQLRVYPIDCVFKCYKSILIRLFLENFGSQGSVALSVNPKIKRIAQFLTEFSDALTYSTEVNTMSQSNSAQNPDPQIKIDNLHASFQQLCFAYGALAFDKNRFNQEKYKWFAEDCKALADSALEIHRLKAGV